MKEKEIRIHPTQKPVALYKAVLDKYAKQGDKILDTHLGSGSSRISADKSKLHFTAFETNEIYFNDQEKRYIKFKGQLRLELT
jgi:site-specific DNA-methyltransferase (adenine-specific)